MISKIKELSRELTRANKAYYNSTKPIITDLVYDAKKDDLKKLLESAKAVDAKEQKIINEAHIVLNKVGHEVSSQWDKVIHTVPMGSLNKINSIEEFNKWYNDISCKDKSLLLTEKLDGMSLDTEWLDGKLIKGATRGNNHSGEDITRNVMKMIGIPKTLNVKFTGNIRGEVVLTKSIRDKHLSGYTALRNAACGLAKRYDGFGTNFLTVLMYKVEGKDFKTETDQFDWLKKIGFVVPNYFLCSDNKDAIIKYNDYFNSKRDKLDYDIDGLVIRLNNMSEQLALGEIHDRPKGAIAFKFDAAGAETICTDIVWQVGNSGRITPVAEFKQIELLGVKIKRASLYNYSYIKEIGLNIGAKIIVIRANDVIPRVEEVSKSTNLVANYPNECPECGSSIHFNGEYLICPNKDTCPPQVSGRLKTWVNELNILEWGKGILDKLAEQGLATDIDGLYALTESVLAKIDRLGEKSAKNLVESLNKHREVQLANLIGGLGIEGIATSTTKLIIESGYDTLEKMYQLDIPTLENIDGFGFIRANAFILGLRENKARIDNILKYVTVKNKIHGSLSGKSFCFTGAMSTPRNKLHALVEENGGTFKKSVGKGLTYLVVDNPNSTTSKIKAAIKIGIKIISENDFMKMI